MPVTTSVVEALTAPPFASLILVLDQSGPYSTGDYTLDTFNTSGAFLLPAGTYGIGGTYGAIVAARGLFPPGAGVSFGWQDEQTFPFGDVYARRIAQLVLQHFLPIAGKWVTTQLQDIKTLEETVFWPVLVLSGARVGLHVEPGWSVDLYYFCVL